MRVRMKTHITGFRNGEPWPSKGGELDLPDTEAADLIVAGYAEEVHHAQADEPAPVDDEPEATEAGGEPGEADDVEESAAHDEPARPAPVKRNRGRKTTG